VRGARVASSQLTFHFVSISPRTIFASRAALGASIVDETNPAQWRLIITTLRGNWLDLNEASEGRTERFNSSVSPFARLFPCHARFRNRRPACPGQVISLNGQSIGREADRKSTMARRKTGAIRLPLPTASRFGFPLIGPAARFSARENSESASLRLRAKNRAADRSRKLARKVKTSQRVRNNGRPRERRVKF